MKTNIPILYYHFINHPDKTARIKGLYTTKKQFEWQLKLLLKRGFNFITFEDIALNRYDASKQNIIITFDDGCVSLYDNAFPIMKKYKIRGVVYVVAESIGKQNVIWEQNENKVPMNILTNEQIIEMNKNGIEIGSHSCDHIHLNQLSVNSIQHELKDSKRLLEELLGCDIYSIAYPYGSYNNNVMKIASEVGYQFGVTTITGDNKLRDNLELYRIPVKGYALRHYWYFYKSLRNILKNKK